MSKTIPVGQEAPNFILRKGNGKLGPEPENMFELQKMRGKNVILSFYPADFSPVCSSEIAIYNELIPTFKQYNAEVFGISVDGTFCHNAFKKDNNLTIELLSDFQPKGEVAKMYHAYDEELGMCKRVNYVLDSDGIVRYAYVSPMSENPGAKEILETLKEIQNK